MQLEQTALYTHQVSAGDYSGDAKPGSIGLDHGLTVTGTTQGAGTSVTAQFVTEITVID